MNVDAEVLTFDNLRQRTAIVGEYQPVQAKATPFVSENAHGILRKVESLKEVSDLATMSGKSVLDMLTA